MERHKLIIGASYVHVRTACEWLHDTLSKIISDEKLYELELAVSEILTNIVKHAYDGGNLTCSIHMTINIYKDTIKILFIDNGKRMPTSLADSLNSSTKEIVLPDAFDEGGRGLFLIKSCVKKVRYHRILATNATLITSYRQ